MLRSDCSLYETNQYLTGIAFVCKVRIRIYEERRLGLSKEAENGADIVGEVRPERAGGRRKRGGQDREGVRRRDSHGVAQTEINESGVNRLHCREKEIHHLSIVPGDFRSAMVGLEVLLNPCLRLRRIDHLLQKLVPQSDHEFHLRIRKRGKNIRICVVELNPSDI
nr:hypothetical protein TorRG33x02_321010 [Ipomoea batatas]